MRAGRRGRNVSFQPTKSEGRISHFYYPPVDPPVEEYFLNLSSNMGQQSSKSTIEARVLFQRVGAMDTKKGACSTPTSVVQIQKKVTSQAACLHSSTRALEKSTHHSRPQSRCDAGGLVYVMDNPTGGVWVKPGMDQVVISRWNLQAMCKRWN